MLYVNAHINNKHVSYNYNKTRKHNIKTFIVGSFNIRSGCIIMLY